MLVTVPSPEIELSTDSIICNVFPTDDGWRVHVRLPRRVSLHDKRAVLEWLRNCSADVRRRNPYWSTRLDYSSRDLTLDLLPADDPRAGMANAFKLTSRGGYGGHDYASL